MSYADTHDETYRRRLSRLNLHLEASGSGVDDDPDESDENTTLRAVLQSDATPEPGDADEDGPTVVSGTIIGEGDRTVSVTAEGTQRAVEWPREVLEAAVEAGVFDSIPITEDHPDPEAPQPPSRAVIGEVLEVDYEPGVGVRYRGEIDDDELAESIENGRLDVSAILAADAEGPDDEGTYTAQSILGVRDLGVVARGAAPGNSIEPATATALSAPGVTTETPDDGDVETESPESPEEPSIDETDEDEADTSADDEAGEETGDTPPEDEGDVSPSDDPEAADEASTDADGDPIDDEPEDGPEDVDVEALEARIDELEAENREMREKFAEAVAKDGPDWLDAETVADRFDFEEICAALEDSGVSEPTDALTLTPNPRAGNSGSGGVRTEALNADSTAEGEGEEGSMTGDDRENLRSLETRIDTIDGVAPEDHVESLRGEAADLAGVDSYEEIDFDEV